jgi:hypothetical protein
MRGRLKRVMGKTIKHIPNEPKKPAHKHHNMYDDQEYDLLIYKNKSLGRILQEQEDLYDEEMQNMPQN